MLFALRFVQREMFQFDYSVVVDCIRVVPFDGIHNLVTKGRVLPAQVDSARRQ